MKDLIEIFVIILAILVLILIVSGDTKNHKKK